MRSLDARRACLALIHHRLCAEVPVPEPSPVALGWQLENSRASARAMAALCAGAMADVGTTRWDPSWALRALLSEYGEVHDGRPGERRRRPGGGSRRRRTADALH